MVKLLLDMLALNVILYIVERDDQIDWAHNALVALGLAVTNFVGAFFLTDKIGLFVLPVIVIVDGLIIMRFCYLTLKQTCMTLVLLIAYNVAFHLVWDWMFQSS